MYDFSRDTGAAKIIRAGDHVLICRPRQRKAVAVLHFPNKRSHDYLYEHELGLVRHLIVRRRSLADYDPDIVASVVRSEKLMDSIVEFPRPWFRKRPDMKTVRLLMAERGLHGTVRPKRKRAWIQIHMGREHRVWDHGIGPVEGLSFSTREEAIIARDRLNVGETPK